jgi:poly-gamma-glutamate system protein
MEVRSLKLPFSKSVEDASEMPAGAAWMRRADLFLLGLAVLGLGLHTLVERTKELHPQRHLEEKLGASSRALRCFEAIRLERVGTPGAADRENDPEASGLIGQEHTLTTTDRGVLEAKLTSVNPNFAAVFVDYFQTLGLKSGDAVAISLTGSFPALNVCMLAAADELGLKPVVITSIGASMWGANDPAFSWLDMESFLRNKALVTSRSVAASLGGSNDRGRGLSPKGRALLRAAIDRNGVALIDEPTLDRAVQRRLEIYDREAGPAKIKAFVNVGGGSASVGNQMGADLVKPGVNRTLPLYNWSQRGVMQFYARRGVPIIHVLNVESIAREYGLPLSPDRIPPVGQGEIFYREVYDLRVVIPALVLYLVLCFGVLRARQRAVRTAQEVADPLIPGVTSQAIGERSGG